jgi:hypothetical protein
VFITDNGGKGNGESVRKFESEQPFGLSISVNTVLFASSCYPQIFNLEKNAGLQIVINTVHARPYINKKRSFYEGSRIAL